MPSRKSTQLQNCPVVALYGPTLASGGAYVSLSAHYSAKDFHVAVVAQPERFAKAFPDFTGEIIPVSGQIDGFRTLSALRRRHRMLTILAVQNPSLWPLRMRATESLIQNAKFIRPMLSWKYSSTAHERVRVILASILTEIQAIRTETTVVLGPSYPRHWNRITRVAMKPNVLPNHVLEMRRQTPEKLVMFVGSSAPFRHADLAIAAYGLSGLGERGWRMAVYAAGPAEERAELKRLAAQTDSTITIAAENAQPLDDLARCRAALFPSAIEAGSSFAFLEALHLSCSVVALDAIHFEQEAPEIPAPARRYFVHGLGLEQWVEQLRRAVEETDSL